MKSQKNQTFGTVALEFVVSYHGMSEILLVQRQALVLQNHEIVVRHIEYPIGAYISTEHEWLDVIKKELGFMSFTTGMLELQLQII